MAISIFIAGDFLDIYPYMNWIFLLNYDGDLFVSRTEKIIDNKNLHDYLFRQNKLTNEQFTDNTTIDVSIEKFSKIAKIADKYSFSDLKFFYSNIFVVRMMDWSSFLSIQIQ